MTDIKLQTLIEQAKERIENLSGDKVNFAFKELFEYADRPDYLTEISGKHFDPKGDYFVLRLDAGEKDKEYLKAARRAINAYSKAILDYDSQLAIDLEKRYPLL